MLVLQFLSLPRAPVGHSIIWLALDIRQEHKRDCYISLVYEVRNTAIMIVNHAHYKVTTVTKSVKGLGSTRKKRRGGAQGHEEGVRGIGEGIIRWVSVIREGESHSGEASVMVRGLRDPTWQDPCRSNRARCSILVRRTFRSESMPSSLDAPYSLT